MQPPRKSIVESKLQDFRKTIMSTRGVMAGLMLVTAAFTGGSVLALWSPDTTWGYILLAVPALVMIVLAEGMFMYWSAKLTDGDNSVQKLTSGLGLLLALATIVLTDASAAVFLAQRSGYVSLYATVPEWAQVVVTYAMPVMAIVHGVLLAIYDAADEDTMAEKEASRKLREAKHEATQAYYKNLAEQYKVHAKQAEKLGQEAAVGTWEADAENFTKRQPSASANGRGKLPVNE